MLLNLDPPVRCYLEQAYSTGIVSCMAGGGDEILNRFINISMPISKLDADKGIVEYPAASKIGDFCAQGFVGVELWTDERHLGLDDKQLGCFLGESLASGATCFLVHLDEYFLPGTFAYGRKKHFRHGALLFDVTQDGKYIMVATYLAGGSYGVAKITLPDLVRALRSPFDRALSYKSKDMIKQIEPVNRQAIGWIDLKRIKRQIAEFLDSKPDMEDIYQSANAKYGIATYQIMSEYINQCIGSGKAIDLRYTRFYMERSALMTKRISRIEERATHSAVPLIREEMARIEQALRLVHIECVLYLRRARLVRSIFRDGHLRLRLTQTILDAAQRESRALSDLMAVL